MKHTEIRALSLYQRFGGKTAVEALVDLFHEKLLADALLEPLLAGVGPKPRKARLVAFLTSSFGGPTDDGAWDLRRAHAHLVARGLGEAHFDAVVEHLATTLAELDVPAPLIAEVLQVAASTRDDVLGL